MKVTKTGVVFDFEDPAYLCIQIGLDEDGDLKIENENDDRLTIPLSDTKKFIAALTEFLESRE